VRGFVRFTTIIPSVAPSVSFPSGTRKLFDQDTPPTGWTRDVTATLDDAIVRIVVGARGPGGGSWTVSGLSGDAHTHTYSTVIAHTHAASVSAHYHTLEAGNPNGTWRLVGQKQDTALATITSSSATPSASVGTTGVTDPATDSVATTVSSDGTWRPLYRDVIIAEKD